MHRYFIIIALLFSFKTYSQSIDISKNWLITIGDTLQWASASYNDSHWKTMEEIGPFERKGFPDFQNFGWLRKKVVFPANLEAAAEKAGFFYLSLGRINDADQTYLNGKLIGQTGGMPPEHIEVNRGKRIYKVAAKDVLWDKENQIAVRIFSNFHNGGLWGENFEIIIPSENIFHVAVKSIPAFPLQKGWQSYEAFANVSLFNKEQTLRAGGIALKLNLPKDVLVFYDNKFIGKTNSSGEQAFFVPASFVSWGNSDKVTVYLNATDALENVLFTTPAFDSIQGDGFHLMQVLNFKMKEGFLNGNSPVPVSMEVLNSTNSNFDGSLTLTLTTDINNIQQSISHPLHLNKMEVKEIDFNLDPDFAGVYQVNYTLQNNKTSEKIWGVLAKGEKP